MRLKTSKVTKGGRPTTEYHLILDMAKELAIVENNDKGRQIRRYFISLERKAVNIDRHSKTPKALPVPEFKRYNYPRKRLEQSYFTEKHPASLNTNMLIDKKQFTSQVKALLNELRTDGHNVDTAWDEHMAIMETIQGQ